MKAKGSGCVGISRRKVAQKDTVPCHFFSQAGEVGQFATRVVQDSVVQTLINLDRYGKEFDSYTESQKGASARFLRYMVEQEGAFFHTWEGILRWADDREDNEPENAIEEALKNYWSRFDVGQ